MTVQLPQPGAVVFDSEHGKRGVVMDTTNGVTLPGRKCIWLRPEGGGLEWLADINQCEAVQAP